MNSRKHTNRLMPGRESSQRRRSCPEDNPYSFGIRRGERPQADSRNRRGSDGAQVGSFPTSAFDSIFSARPTRCSARGRRRRQRCSSEKSPADRAREGTLRTGVYIAPDATLLGRLAPAIQHVRASGSILHTRQCVSPLLPRRGDDQTGSLLLCTPAHGDRKDDRTDVGQRLDVTGAGEGALKLERRHEVEAAAGTQLHAD